MAKVSVNTTIEADMKAEFEIIANRNYLSCADAMRVAIMEYIQKHEKNNGKIPPEEINQMLLIDESTTIRKAMIWARRLYHHTK